MDLGAYAQINTLDKVMQENNIVVPRLRGLRLMSEEKPISPADIKESIKKIALFECESACELNFRHDAHVFCLSAATDRLKRKYLIYEKDSYSPKDVNWSAIHGKKRKLFKYIFKRAEKKNKENLETFNKYCGRDDVLYIHARIGGGNWPYYHAEVDTQPWFIEKVDDPFDSTYCDIYAKIKPMEIKE